MILPLSVVKRSGSGGRPRLGLRDARGAGMNHWICTRRNAWVLAFIGAPALACAQFIAPPLPVVTEGNILFMTAQFATENKPIRSGLIWRVFTENADPNSDRPLQTSTDAAPAFRLDPGTYVVHVAYGMAATVRRVTITRGNITERVSLAVGGLKLAGAIGQTPIPAPRVSFNVYAPLPNNSEGRLVAGNVKAGDILRLPEGAYHLVSTYGDTNAVQRADIKVESGKLTEATMNHRAATVTLKLVTAPGGEALAGTAFSVLTPGGDVIRELIGAYPNMILAEGEYVAIARHQGKVYQRPFKVDSGIDRDIEVLAK